MDILASMLAYLGCVTGIVGALAISLFVFFSAPGQQIVPNSTLAVAAKPSAVQTAAVTGARPASTSTVAKIELARASKIAANTPKTQVSATQVSAAPHRLVQEERARRFAYQQDPAFEARFLGYTD
jgi:hypothetical protein